MIHEIVITQFRKMLGNLLTILDEGEAYATHKGFDVDVLLRARLAPDQFDLIRQIQIACDNAKMAAARLSGTEAKVPVHPDTEKTLAEVKARIESTVRYLGEFAPTDFAVAAERRISQPRWKEKSLSGTEFVVQYALPNFYFHVTTAYAILRHNGVPVGKKHYLGELPFKE